jgi:hypothetical protein
MKKIALIILVAGFAFGAQAQNSPEPAGVENGCIPDETEDHYVTKEEKKRKNRMGTFAHIDPKEQNSLSNNPYAFASEVSETKNLTEVRNDSAEKSKFRIAIGNLKIFFRIKLFQKTSVKMNDIKDADQLSD